jgi:hypothetical protein
MKCPDSAGDRVGDRINYLSQMIMKIGAKPAESYAQPRVAHDAELEFNKMIAEMQSLQTLSLHDRQELNKKMQQESGESEWKASPY